MTDIPITQHTRWLTNAAPNDGLASLRDANPATTATFNMSVGNSEYAFELYGDYAAYLGQVIGIKVEFDVVSVTGTVETGLEVKIFADAPRPDGGSMGFGEYRNTFASVPGPGTYSVTITDVWDDGSTPPLDFDQFIVRLNDTSGPSPYRHVYGTFENLFQESTATVVVSEVRFFLVTADEPPVERWIRRPLRMHPRSDGLGMSTTRRYGTNSRSIQASMRRGGGTYI